ncbi:restriction endonuclease [Melittangium boletus]|uniref:Uncharacterized protein n=1 Tax=Melittangium boletus DSM 14713 TaxID=1294270 RepID=A0A250IDJ3_9BACT|nr:restriction endonuclease [Melittangium boletus]ATB29270.1 hypothetical protein MEBOL_002719 [Melittangium boletus DSM 14713]
MPLTFTKTVHPINFSDLSGQEFERLVFATLLRMYAWHTLDWFGQTGSDGGRDIVGTRDDDSGNRVTVIVACANWKSFTSTKGNSDIDKIVAGIGEIPREAIVIAGSPVSAATKEKCRTHAAAKGIVASQVWSGPEFEERLRFHANSVLQRFYLGNELPDEAPALRTFVEQLDPTTEREAGELIARIFDRPAFSTPIRNESHLPAFRQAIGDTIGALNTGIWRDREGAIITRVPARQSFPNGAVKDALAECVAALNALRMTFDEGLRSNRIQPCPCGKTDCPVFMIEHAYCDRLEAERDRVLSYANAALSELGVAKSLRAHNKNKD